MKQLHYINITSKEKELALSLLRIPINFFAEDNSKNNTTTNTSASANANSQDLKANDARTKNVEKKQVELTGDNPVHVNISKDIEFDGKTPARAQAYNTEEDSSVETPEEPSSQEKPITESEATAVSDSSSGSSTQTTTATSPVNKQNIPSTNQPLAQAEATTAQRVATPPKKGKISSPPQDEQNKTTTPLPEDEISPKKLKQPTEKSEPVEPDNKKDKPKNSDDKKDKPKDSNDKKDKPKDSEKSKEKPKGDNDKLKDYNDRFGKKRPKGKKVGPASAKKGVGDKLSKNPAAKKAMSKFNTAQKIKDTAQTAKEAMQDMDQGKMQEVAGEVAVQVAKKIPGPVGAAVTVADTVAGDTKVGKKVKKGIGWCCMFGCVFLAAIILMPVVFLMQLFAGSTNNNDYGDIVNELSSSDASNLEQAGLENSLQGYTNDTILIGLSSSNSIQNVLQDYLDNRYYYTEDQAKKYNNKYASLIELGLLFEVSAGDLTNFGMTFEIIKGNYTIDNLKAPTSAPKRIKKVDGEEIVYTTFNPKGIHQALFEDVLTNMDGLINRFDGQVSKEWFNELGRINVNGNPINTNSILDKKFDVYIENLNETQELSLRDLFIETSTTSYDTEYYAGLVKTTLTKYSIKNAEIIEQYDELVERLTMLELMTYMLAYQKYYNQLINFVDAYDKYDNISMFDPRTHEGEDFWGQFLTFSNVEHYIALSGLTDHSLTYEIAVASINTATNTIDVDLIDKSGKHFVGIRKFENWYATYYFTPQVPYVDGSYKYIISNPPPDVKQTQIQNYLFDKYNIGFGLFDNDSTLTTEEKAHKNQNTFFALFEAATGIKMSQYNENGKLQTAIYNLDPAGISRDRYFPVEDSSLARVTHGYNQLYSDETVATFGLSHNNHTGIDYAVPVGTTIVASSSGTAYVSRGNTGYGNYVKILHDDGYSSIYAHGNGTFFINNGARVVSGQPIMQSGNSGNSTGPHLHFEVRKPSGTTVNPTSYIYGNA